MCRDISLSCCACVQSCKFLFCGDPRRKTCSLTRNEFSSQSLDTSQREWLFGTIIPVHRVYIVDVPLCPAVFVSRLVLVWYDFFWRVCPLFDQYTLPPALSTNMARSCHNVLHDVLEPHPNMCLMIFDADATWCHAFSLDFPWLFQWRLRRQGELWPGSDSKFFVSPNFKVGSLKALK